MKPLEDITVLDLTTALAGPFATLLLAGLGAKVIKIENPIGGGDTCRSNAPYLGSEGGTLARQHADDISVSALNRLRNKLGVTLNLKHPECARRLCRPGEEGRRHRRKFQPRHARSPGRRATPSRRK